MVIFYWKHQQLIKAADCHFPSVLEENDEVNKESDKIYFYVPPAIRFKTSGLV